MSDLINLALAYIGGLLGSVFMYLNKTIVDEFAILALGCLFIGTVGILHINKNEQNRRGLNIRW